MNIIGTFNNVLAQLKPFVGMVALLFGIIAAWLAMVELLPVLAQIWRPKGDMQRYAIVAGALSWVGSK